MKQLSIVPLSESNTAELKSQTYFKEDRVLNGLQLQATSISSIIGSRNRVFLSSRWIADDVLSTIHKTCPVLKETVVSPHASGLLIMVCCCCCYVCWRWLNSGY